MKKVLIFAGAVVLCAGLYIGYFMYTTQSDTQCIIEATDLSDPFTYGEQFVLKNVYEPCGVSIPENESLETLQACVRKFYQSDDWQTLKQNSDKKLAECHLRINGQWF